MPVYLRAGLLLLMAIQPLALLAADLPPDPLVARGDRNFPPYEFINANGEPDGFNIDLLKAIKDITLAEDTLTYTYERPQAVNSTGRR